MNDQKKITIFNYSIIAICALLFLFMRDFKTIEDYNNYLLSANSLEYPLSFLFSNFSHGSFLHIGLNMYFLYMINKGISKIVSFKHLLGAFFFSLVFTTLFVFLFLNIFNLENNVLGASGWLFGYLAYFMCFFNIKVFTKDILINIAIHIAIIFFDFPIAWYAHLGGFISGVIYYCLFNFKEKIILPDS